MKALSSDQKLRGGYYTPPEVSTFLAHWAVRSPGDHILEPSCGDGQFVEAATAALKAREASKDQIKNQIHAVELEASEAQKARLRLHRLGFPVAKDAIHTGDFFRWRDKFGFMRFDAVLGNPPFIRYQHFPDEHREMAFAMMRSAGLRPNGLTNAWVPFVCLSSLMLKEGGRLAMVLPSELLQVSYSAELRKFLSESFQRVTLFTFRELLFKDAQQEVVLFCGERGKGKEGAIKVVELANAASLSEYRPRKRHAYKPMDHSTEKWTQYFLTGTEIDILRAMRAHKGMSRLGQIASVDVGVVTGLNEFFVLTNEERAGRGLDAYTGPVVTRSAHIQGLVFKAGDFQAQAKQNARTHLLKLPMCSVEKLPSAGRKYILEGEEKGYHLGFKCRNRKPWWAMPEPWIPDGFMLRQIHKHPKIAINRTGATCTDTIHRVRMLNGTTAETLATGFLNSLTFAFSEVVGRSYGGGILELEPTEAEKLPLPLAGAEKLDLSDLHRLLIEDRIIDALEESDRVLLREGLGLSKSDAMSLRGVWLKLMERRHARKISRRPVSDRQREPAVVEPPEH